MKAIHRFIFSLIALSGMLITACTDKDGATAEKSKDVTIKGIVAYCPSEDREIDELTASLNTATSLITLTTTPVYSNETPVDLSNVIIQITLAKGATSDLKSTYNLADGNTGKLIITAEDGVTTAEWTIKAVRADNLVVIPKSVTATATPVWSRSSSDLGLKSPLWGSRAMDCYREAGNDYLYILDNELAPGDNNRIRIHNAKTGDFIDDIKEYEGGAKGCRSYMWALKCDEAGHIAISRLNADQAGFWLDLYDNAGNGWAYLGTPLKYPQNQEGLTYYAGKKVNIVGDLVNGQGMVIATCGHFYGSLAIYAEYNTFMFSDGVPAASIVQNSYPASAPTEWWAGEVQQESLANPTLYVTIVDEYNYGGDTPEEQWPTLHASTFEIYDPVAGTTVAVDESCFNYRILASEVFNCGSGKYLYTLEQSYSPKAPYVERLYYISDTELLKTVTADSEDFDKFLLWESEPDDIGGAVTNVDNRFGSVCVLPDATGTSAVLFCYHANTDSEKAKVCATRVTFEETFE